MQTVIIIVGADAHQTFIDDIDAVTDQLIVACGNDLHLPGGFDGNHLNTVEVARLELAMETIEPMEGPLFPRHHAYLCDSPDEHLMMLKAPTCERMACTLPFIERTPSHGQPRSIRETMRQQGRGQRASAMRGWKRK